VATSRPTPDLIAELREGEGGGWKGESGLGRGGNEGKERGRVGRLQPLGNSAYINVLCCYIIYPSIILTMFNCCNLFYRGGLYNVN